MLKAAVFDMDGLMFDTETLVYRNWQTMMDEAGYPYSLDDFKQTVGKRKAEVQNFYFGRYGADFPYWDFSEKGRGMYLEYVAERGVPVKPGLHELLEYLRANGAVVALASSTTYDRVVMELKDADLFKYFRVIVGGNMIEHSKPEPDIYLLACKKLGADPTKCIAVEDSRNGIISASRAGMMPLLVPDILKPDEEMLKLAHAKFDDLLQVKDYLEA